MKNYFVLLTPQVLCLLKIHHNNSNGVKNVFVSLHYGNCTFLHPDNLQLIHQRRLELASVSTSRNTEPPHIKH